MAVTAHCDQPTSDMAAQERWLEQPVRSALSRGLYHQVNGASDVRVGVRADIEKEDPK